MATYRDTVSDTVHELDPETFGAKLLAQLVAEGVLVEDKPKARKAPAPKAAPPAGEPED